MPLVSTSPRALAMGLHERLTALAISGWVFQQLYSRLRFVPARVLILRGGRSLSSKAPLRNIEDRVTRHSIHLPETGRMLLRPNHSWRLCQDAAFHACCAHRP